MISAGNTARSIRRRLLLAGAALPLLLPASGVAATGASLKITVSPTNVRQGHTYVITVRGSFQQRQLRGTAYLWEFVQYAPAACKATARAEQKLPTSDLSLDYRGKEHSSPFTRRDRWTAGNITGVRHICAYLYPKVVSATSNVRPIATADARYRDV